MTGTILFGARLFLGLAMLPGLSFAQELPLSDQDQPGGGSMARASDPDTLVGLVVLIKFREQDVQTMPSVAFVKSALDAQVGDYYGHATDWKVKPMSFIVTEYFTPAMPFNAYDWWSRKGSWDNHFTLLREIASGIADGTIKARSANGTIGPVDLRRCLKDASGKVLSSGTTYFVDKSGTAGVFGRANGNSSFWPQTKEVEDAIRKKFACRLGSYSSGFIVGTYGSYDDPNSVDIGAQIHEIGHEFLHWPDISADCYGYNDWEIVKRISTVNKTGPSCVIRELNEVPDGSTVSVSIGDWDVWGFKNVKSNNEFIVFENAGAKGYTSSFGKKHPDKNLLVFRLDTRKQTQVNVTNLATATWADGTPVGFDIESISAPGDVMSFKLRNSTPGAARDCGTAGGIRGYPIELYENPDQTGAVGAFGRSKYYASWMPRMGIEPGMASAIRILPGYKVSLFEGRKLQGPSCVLTNAGTAPVIIDLTARQFNKKASSLKVEAITESHAAR